MSDGHELAPHRGGLRRYRVAYESELNPEQLRVVMHPGGPMLALAGAGSGKTRTLVYRVARLIEDGVPPPAILLLTFTNKAAKEMLERVEALTQATSGRVTGGTFHAVGNRLLRRYAEVIGYTPRFSILDREDAVDLMGAALAEVEPETPNRRAPRAELLVSIYSYVINTGRDLEETVTERAPQYLDQVATMARVFKAYLARKRKADAMDFDDLLLNWLLLLSQHPSVRRELCQRFAHVLVDEYQDTNRLQADIVDGLLGRERNLMVVGDDAQSIYAFRGAEFANILTFPERHPGCEIFKLELNYRSTPAILALANASIACNVNQFPKALSTVRSGGQLPCDVAAADPEAQARFVADTVLALREEGLALEDMVVLYRNHSHSLELQVELTRRNIPYRVRSGVRFFEQRHVKDVLAHLRFVTNPRDEVAFCRLAKLRPGFGPRLTARLWDGLGTANPLRALLARSAAELDLPGRARASFDEIRALLDDLNAPLMTSQPGESIRLVVQRFYRDYLRDNLDNWTARLDDLEQLALYADRSEDVNSFLAELSLLTDLSGEDVAATTPDECLTLSSAHQAKGLEWRAVFVIWLAEGRFPSQRAEDEEEERRLFYVSVTRARDRLYLVHPQLARDRYRVDVIVNPSRFLAELPDHVTERVSAAADEPEDGIDALPPGRYQLPGFLTGGGDVN